MTFQKQEPFGKRLLYFPVDNPSGVSAAPLGVWYFDGTSSWLVDRTGNGRDFSVVTGSFEFESQNGLTGARFDTSQDHELILPAEEALRVAQNELGTDDASLTLEAVVNASAGGIIITCDAGGESLETNYLWQLGPVWDDSGVLRYYSFAEYGGGANINVYSTAEAVFDDLIYLALTISADGKTWKWYVNGVLAGSASLTNAPQKSSGGSNTQRVRVGRQDSDTNDFRGIICSFRMTAETFDDADIADTWETLQDPTPQDATEEPFHEEASGGDVASLLDDGTIVATGGPQLHSAPEGVTGGQLVPGPATQQPGSIGPFDIASVLDEADFEIGKGDIDFGLDSPSQVVPKASLLDWAQHYDGYTATYSATTTDSEGHPHFLGDRAYLAFMYDAYAEGALWTTPTDPAFTGYGKDGYYYIAGVNQGTLAPWAAESASDDRSSRASFPDKVLVVAAQVDSTTKEVVIFDMDAFPAFLDVWMRFKPRDGNNSFWMIGNENRSVKSIAMAGGVLLVGTEANAANGGIHIINFMATDQDCGHLVRADNHYKVKSGYTIANRNTQTDWTTSGLSPSLRIAPESVYSVAASPDGTDTWIACAGEDQGPDVMRVDVSPRELFAATGETGEANTGDTRRVMFDEAGWLWFTNGSRIVRNIIDYREGVVYIPESNVGYARRGSNPTWVDLPVRPLVMKHTADYIFAATERGVYRIHRGTFEYELVYSTAGGSGTHKILVSEFPDIRHVYAMSLSFSSYLTVSTGLVGEGTLIRLLDDSVVDAREYPDLSDPGCYFQLIWTNA